MDLGILPVQAVKLLMVGTKGVLGLERPFNRPYPRVGMHFSSFDAQRINDDVAFLLITKVVFTPFLATKTDHENMANIFELSLLGIRVHKKTPYFTIYIFHKHFHLLIKYRYNYVTFMTT